MQNFASEIDWLRKKVSENPASMLHTRLAERYLNMKEIDRAMELAEKGVILHPDYPTARVILAKCFFERRQYDLANQSLKEVLNADPRHPAALKLSCDLMRRLGNLEQAREIIKRLVEIDPIDSTLSMQLKDLDQEQAPRPAVPSSFPKEMGGTLDDWESAFLKPDDEHTERVDSDQAVAEPPTEPMVALPPPMVSDDPFDDFEKESKSRTQKSATSDYQQEEVLDEQIDGDFTIDPTRYREEESRFTQLLDDIFSSSIDREEQRAVIERSAIERIAKTDDDLEEYEDQQPIRPEGKALEPASDASSVDDILKSSFSDKDAFGLLPEIESLGDDDEVIPQDFMPFEDEPLRKRQEPAKEEPRAEQPPDNTVEMDFHEFLSSLNIRDDSMPTSREIEEPPVQPIEPKRGFDFMQSLPDIDDELDDDDFSPDPENDISRRFTPSKPQEVFDVSLRDDEEKGGRSKGKFFTPTLGEIYAAQGQYAKAIAVFESLLKKDPQNQVYRQKLEYLTKKLNEQQNQ